MMTSSNGIIFRVTGPLWRPVTQSFDVFFDLRLNKRLSKQPWGWWFETPSLSLWHQCNENKFTCEARLSQEEPFASSKLSYSWWYSLHNNLRSVTLGSTSNEIVVAMEKFEKCAVALQGGPCFQHVTGNMSWWNQTQDSIKTTSILFNRIPFNQLQQVFRLY